MVVDGYSTGNALARVFAGYGYDTLHVLSSADIPDVFARTIRPYDYADSFVYHGDDDEVCAWLLEGGRRLLCMVAAGESGVMLADRITERIGLCSNGTALSPARRDKALMAQAVADASLATIPYLRSGRLREIEDWIASNGLRTVVLKPLSSSGTFGFHICDRETGVEQTVVRLLESKDIFGTVVDEVVVQPYVEGDEFCVNAVSYEGRHHVTDIWRTKKRRCGQSKVYDLEMLVSPDEPVHRTLREYAGQVLDALGIRYGPTHTEVMLTPEGPVLIESAARFMGSLDTSLVTQATGTNAVLVTAEAYLTPACFLARCEEPTVELRRHAAMVQMVASGTGELSGYRLDRLAALPTFHGVDTYLMPGDPVRPTIDSYSSPGLIFLIANSEAELMRDYHEIRRIEARGELYELASSRRERHHASSGAR